MYISEMLSSLDDRLEDPGRLEFLVPTRLRALYNSMLTLMGANLDRKYTKNLEITASGVACLAGGRVPLSQLSGLALDAKGVRQVRTYRSGSPSLWAREIRDTDRASLRNSYLAGHTLEPRWFAEAGHICLNPSTVSMVDVTYLRLPKPLLAAIPFTTAGTLDGFVCAGLAGSGNDFTGAPLYNSQSGKYHIVTAYDDLAGAFTVTPSHSGVFTTGTVSFLTDDFRLLALDTVVPELNEALHPLMLLAAEVELWPESWDLDRKNAARDDLKNQLALLEGRIQQDKPKGIGYDAKGR